ncbi:M61 family metallopeptidase [Aliidiomarina celeris]|uniref:M61 family metallopeptidase n=1 Tax=Aliidiomarina celeris TaxID=2249428 RepID=UPI000DE908C2|nr:PDZ domain-containing protein [Aliidiomarina celeris]
MSTIRYEICATNPDSHYFDVKLEFSLDSKQNVELTLPSWIPGSYMIRDFAKHIVGFEAYGESGALTYLRPNKSTWIVKNAQGQVRIHYRVYAFDSSIRAAYLDRTYGFFNGTSLCLAVAGMQESRHEVQVLPSPHPAIADFEVATGLAPFTCTKNNNDPKKNSNLCYYADNYDALIDHPFLLGKFTRIQFTASGIPHALVLVGQHFASEHELARDLKQICEAQHNLWGEVPDFEQYLFLTIVTANGFGGLEHRNSTALMCSRAALEFGGGDQASDAYLEFLSLCSHEYFHNWNVKRLKPKAFLPYALHTETYTEQLWFYEGVTSFYDDLMVYRAGCMSQAAFLKRLSTTISRGLRGQGPLRQTLTESSQLAWTTFYQQDENAVNAIASYYAKGAVVALCLDLLLRKLSNHSVNLDHVLKQLYQTYGPSQGKTPVGTEQADLLSSCNPIEHPAVDEFLHQALYTTKPLPWRELLEQVGVSVQESAFEDALTLGASLKELPLGMQVQRVLEKSMAASAGLAARDILIAMDGLQATAGTLKAALHRYHEGDEITLVYLRDERLLSGQCIWQHPATEKVELTLASNAVVSFPFS